MSSVSTISYEERLLPQCFSTNGVIIKRFYRQVDLGGDRDEDNIQKRKANYHVLGLLRGCSKLFWTCSDPSGIPDLTAASVDKMHVTLFDQKENPKLMYCNLTKSVYT